MSEARGVLWRGRGPGLVLAVEEHFYVVNGRQHQHEDAAEKPNGEDAFENVYPDCDPKIHGCCPTGRLMLLNRTGNKDGVRNA